MQSPEIQQLAQTFERFGQYECVPASPLYGRLCLGIAHDPVLLELAAHAHARPVPNLFLAAVHYLLLRGRTHPLAEFYPTLTPQPDLQTDPYPAFRAFCMEYSTQIELLLATRLVQTNEVQRCTVLLPAFGLVSNCEQDMPLALLEIGTSAGLNLLWDAYCYDYGGERKYGNLQSPVQLHCEVHGVLRPPVPEIFPQVAFRAGIDLNPVDVRDNDARLWLQALIWPEQTYRAVRLQKALNLAEQNPLVLLNGNALEVLPELLPTVPKTAALCLFHSFTLNQFTPIDREALSQILTEFSKQRDLYRVGLEHNGQEVVLTLYTYKQGVENSRRLAYTEGHGSWLEWLEQAI